MIRISRMIRISMEFCTFLALATTTSSHLNLKTCSVCARVTVTSITWRLNVKTNSIFCLWEDNGGGERFFGVIFDIENSYKNALSLLLCTIGRGWAHFHSFSRCENFRRFFVQKRRRKNDANFHIEKNHKNALSLSLWCIGRGWAHFYSFSRCENPDEKKKNSNC